MKKNIRFITETAVMLALLIALQALTKPMGQLVTGSCVNGISMPCAGGDGVGCRPLQWHYRGGFVSCAGISVGNRTADSDSACHYGWQYGVCSFAVFYCRKEQ